MTKVLQQGRGYAAEISVGFESVFNTAATTARRLAHNGSTITARRDLNQSGTILAGRSPAEPFQGNGQVEGSITLPNDLNQLAIFLKAIFGNPTSTEPDDAVAASQVTDNEDGTVTLTVGEGHGVTQGAYFIIYGTTNYNGEHAATAVTSTTITFVHAYTAEAFTKAKVSKSGWTHVFRVPRIQPSLTIEQLHTDLAEMFLYTGCKVSRFTIGAGSDGQENTVTVDIMGSKPADNVAPIAISTFATSSEGAATLITTATAHGLAAGNRVIIAGSTNYDGSYTVATAPDGVTFTIAKAYVTETVTQGQEPVLCKAHFAAPKSLPLKRLNTFSGKLYYDGVEYKAAKSISLEIDFGLDGDQRVIGDNGFRSEIPEGEIAATTNLTVLLKDGGLYRKGESNADVALKLAFIASFGIGSLTIDMPENKVALTSPAIESPRGITQTVSAQAYSSDTSDSGSAIIVTLINAYATI
jgi:hypothetical protein